MKMLPLLFVISRCVNILILSGHFTPACTPMNIIPHYHMLYRYRPTICFFFFFVALSPNARRSHELCQLQMRLAVISRLKKFGTQHCEGCREHVMTQIKQNLLCPHVFFWPVGQLPTHLASFAHSSKNQPFVMSRRVPIPYWYLPLVI